MASQQHKPPPADIRSLNIEHLKQRFDPHSPLHRASILHIDTDCEHRNFFAPEEGILVPYSEPGRAGAGGVLLACADDLLRSVVCCLL